MTSLSKVDLLLAKVRDISLPPFKLDRNDSLEVSISSRDTVSEKDISTSRDVIFTTEERSVGAVVSAVNAEFNTSRPKREDTSDTFTPDISCNIEDPKEMKVLSLAVARPFMALTSFMSPTDKTKLSEFPDEEGCATREEKVTMAAPPLEALTSLCKDKNSTLNVDAFTGSVNVIDISP
jgi:hypothetical protein